MHVREKEDCLYTHAQPAHFRVNYHVTCDFNFCAVSMTFQF
jgi:hypothetical protein